MKMIHIANPSDVLMHYFLLSWRLYDSLRRLVIRSSGLKVKTNLIRLGRVQEKDVPFRKQKECFDAKQTFLIS